MLLVKMLCSLLIITFIDGCALKTVPVPQRCVVPPTDEPIIDNTPCPKEDYKCKAQKSLKNYEAQKKYAKDLKNNSEVCR